jgi:subtilase family serine protease
VPDVAALADPYTGFPIVITSGTKQYGEVYGGTSLASPIFTANWAIAQQYNGGALGQAARAVSKLTKTQIADVVTPAASINKYDVTGSLVDSNGTTTFTAATLFTDAEDLESSGNLSLYSQSKFLSAVYPSAWGYSYIDAVVSFGTDTSLTVGSGWDHVTGWGEPNGLPFIQGVTGKTTGATLTK